MLIHIFIGFIMLMSINSMLIEHLDKLTTYSQDTNYFDSKYRLMFLFFGVLCYFFLSSIRHSRKIYFYKNRLKHITFVKKMMGGWFNGESDETKKEFIKIKRILALNKLRKRKINIQVNILSFLDLFFSRVVYYRKICGGIWRKVHIVHEYRDSKVKWVRENWKTSDKYYHEIVEAYGQHNYEKSKNYKSFNYKLN